MPLSFALYAEKQVKDELDRSSPFCTGGVGPL
jgi:hypothetical protein